MYYDWPIWPDHRPPHRPPHTVHNKYVADGEGYMEFYRPNPVYRDWPIWPDRKPPHTVHNKYVADGDSSMPIDQYLP